MGASSNARIRACVVRIHAKQDMRTEQVPGGPEPGADEVRLRVGYVGICGSDLHYYADGAAGIFIRAPLIPGHEVSGVIDLDPTGAFEAGTLVTVHPATWGTARPDLFDEQRHLWPGGGYLGSASTWPHTPGARGAAGRSPRSGTPTAGLTAGQASSIGRAGGRSARPSGRWRHPGQARADIGIGLRSGC